MEVQREIINTFLRNIYKIRRENEKGKTDNLVQMRDTYNKKNEYFYFQVFLLEMIPKMNAIVFKKNFQNLSPQEIYIGYLKGEKKYTNFRELVLYQNSSVVDLLNMVTPNLNKNIWYLETDLISNRLIKLLCRMNLMDMKKMLKNTPIPDICCYPSVYKIDDPQKFVKIINENIKYKHVFDFIPYVREFSIKNKTINDKSVYYLYKEIEMVNTKCLLGAET